MLVVATGGDGGGGGGGCGLVVVVVGGAAVVVGVVCGKSVCEESREPPTTSWGESFGPLLENSCV